MLRYFNMDQMSLTKCHIIWEAAISSENRALQRVVTKVKLAIETYNLHGRRIHYMTPGRKPDCKLCGPAFETREHVLVH